MSRSAPRFHGVIAIDGPSGSGKSTVARAIAAHLGLRYLDTGAMYRAATVSALDAGLDLDDSAAVAEHVRGMDLHVSTDPADQTLLLNGADITATIRTEGISLRVSVLAANLDVRRELIARQQAIVADGRGIVLEGRDTTTVVAPEAEVRILITADPHERIARRSAELHGEVTGETLRSTRAHVVERDAQDAAVTSFHTASDGVHTLDTSRLDIGESIEAVLNLVARSMETRS